MEVLLEHVLQNNLSGKNNMVLRILPEKNQFGLSLNHSFKTNHFFYYYKLRMPPRLLGYFCGRLSRQNCCKRNLCAAFPIIILWLQNHVISDLKA